MDEPGRDQPKRVQIRKYPNRRYYDASRSRHVTLEEIYGLIRDGNEIEVVDSKTGEDITAKVLAQIIIELDPPKLGVFPVALLHRILRSNEQIVNDFVQKYFSQAFTAFLDSQRNMEQYMRQAMGMQNSAPTVSDWTKLMWGSLNPALWPQAPSGQGRPAAQAEPAPGSPAPAAAPAAASPAVPPSPAPAPDSAQNGAHDDLRAVVDDLRREIGQLQEQVRAGRPNGRKTRTKRTR